MDDKKLQQKYQNKVNNIQGQYFEGYIKAACMNYRNIGRAEIDKTPEPFRVLTKDNKTGKFTGRFTREHAQPDFQGTLQNGKSICFEAKYTTTDTLKRSILTENQMKLLESHHKLGALTGICAGIQEEFFFIHWIVWRDMKKYFKKQSLTAKDIKIFKIKFNGAVMFLDFMYEKEIKQFIDAILKREVESLKSGGLI
ncbi:Holliday junction resolvase RecU [Clostridioides difficile]|nr:Holliday junction resolvase RecU [uncultured Clostridioides sp.]EGT5422326.1 hypothetical protein [Clostridioides difficile]MBH7487383.1 Holliday junction resolvase RecU [Clostridioides difficile]MBY1671772.1 Holliday junction resolvase RecU [Clostridioides difficile]MBY1793850.1 Holliday junction resolvase RecU [Clostridioides difficile]MBY1996654.1 Holliday junction resolvase RecU [Clostridioides difficile]